MADCFLKILVHNFNMKEEAQKTIALYNLNQFNDRGGSL
jgi:hypothetical protein